MGLAEMVIIAMGLAADSFAVSVSSGAIIGKMRIRYAMRIAIFFSFFQGLMPWIGWKVGSFTRGYIESIDHWLAFGLLSFIGGKMIYESLFHPTANITYLYISPVMNR